MKSAINRAGVTQTWIAEQLGIDNNTVWRWSSGRHDPDDKTKKELATLLNVSVAYLMGETDDTIDMSQARYPDFIRVPVYDADTCAGNGWSHDYVDAELLEHMVLPSSEVGPISPDPDKQPFVVPVKGDSMEEAGLPDEANVCVNPAAEVHDGDAALVKYGDNGDVAIKWVYFHRNGSIELRSSSLRYPPKIFTREDLQEEDFYFKIVGKVMLSIGKPKRGA